MGEIDLDQSIIVYIHRRLIVYIPSSIFIQSLRKAKAIHPELHMGCLLSILFCKHLLMAVVDQTTHRGLILYILFQISIKNLRKSEEMDLDIHRRLIVYIPSQISIQSVRKQMAVHPELHMGACCLYSFSNSYQRLSQITQAIQYLLFISFLRYPLNRSRGEQTLINRLLFISIEDLLSIFLLRYSFRA